MDPHLHDFNPTQQQGTGLRRFLSLYITARSAKWGLGTLVFLGLAQVAFKDELKPMNVAGQMVGSLWSAEQDAARRATVQTTEQMADAQAKAQARAQQQVMVQQMQQQYGLMTAMPTILFQWFLQGKCFLAMYNNDPRAAIDCAAAQKLAAIINGQAGASMDSLGTTHAWGEAPKTAPAAPVPVADQPPLSQVEIDRMNRLEHTLKPESVEWARKRADLGTNRGQRLYVETLGALAGDRVQERTRAN